MYSLLVILHVIICLVLIFVILLQRSRGAEMGVTFGGASQTLFGAGGSMDFLNKVTTGLAILFFITSISLSYISAHRSNIPNIQPIPAPATSVPKASTKTLKTPKPLTNKSNSDKK